MAFRADNTRIMFNITSHTQSYDWTGNTDRQGQYERVGKAICSAETRAKRSLRSLQTFVLLYGLYPQSEFIHASPSPQEQSCYYRSRTWIYTMTNVLFFPASSQTRMAAALTLIWMVTTLRGTSTAVMTTAMP